MINKYEFICEGLQSLTDHSEHLHCGNISFTIISYKKAVITLNAVVMSTSYHNQKSRNRLGVYFDIIP